MSSKLLLEVSFTGLLETTDLHIKVSDQPRMLQLVWHQWLLGRFKRPAGFLLKNTN